MRQNVKLDNIIKPEVEALGYVLAGIELLPMGNSHVLRIYLDSKIKDTQVTIDDCAKVSRQISNVLDVADVIYGKYTLEVSSPGLDRLLFDIEQFAENIGENISVRLGQPLNNRRNFKGVLKKVEEKQVLILVEGTEYVIPFDAIDKARVVPNV